MKTWLSPMAIPAPQFSCFASKSDDAQHPVEKQILLFLILTGGNFQEDCRATSVLLIHSFFK